MSKGIKNLKEYEDSYCQHFAYVYSIKSLLVFLFAYTYHLLNVCVWLSSDVEQKLRENLLTVLKK